MTDIDIAAIGQPDDKGQSNSPGIGNTAGGGGSSQHIDAKRTRLGELLTMERCWRYFRKLDPSGRQKVVTTVENWRDDDGPWSMWDLATPQKACRNHDLDWEDVRKGLLADDFGQVPSADQDDRKRLLALLDVAKERGPGFDMIDPFGPWRPIDGDSPPEIDVHRVEVKTMATTTSMRAKLTGNEYRMACTRGPEPDDTDGSDGSDTRYVDRYLLRLTVMPRDGNATPSVFDLEDFVGAAELTTAKFVQDLRGGYFYVKHTLSS